MPDKPLNIGDLRQRVTVQQITSEAQNGFGETDPSWGDYVTLWAKIEPMTAKQIALNAAYQQGTVKPFTVTTRYYPGITTMMRLMWGTRIFAINSVTNEDGYDHTLTLHCTEFNR